MNVAQRPHLVSALRAGTNVARPDCTLIGRERELDRLRTMLKAAVDGQRQVLLLSGEPGIGKTRCAEVFARVAEDQGAVTLWGRCYEEPGSPPYWPWMQILREYVQSCSESELRSMIAGRAHDIAAIVPDLVGPTEQRTLAEAMIPEDARFRAFDAIAQFLAGAARRSPLVLILDNLHWADTPSLSLLEFVGQELSHSRVLIVGTFRDAGSLSSPLARALGGLSRENGVERIRLGGLPETSIPQLAERALGISLAQRAVQAIYQLTDGNPLFVVELLKVLQQENAGTSSDLITVRIPDTVRETIGRRLSHLSDPCNRLLAIASVSGRYFTATEIAKVAEQELRAVLASLDAAAKVALIESSGVEADGYRFTHALIREVLYDELPSLERLRLHGRVADVLVQMRGTNPTPVLSSIAHHYSEAVPLGYREQAITFEFRAAAHATHRCAYEDAVAHYERAIAALLFDARGDDERIVTAYFLQGRAFCVLGDIRAGTEALLQGVKQAVRLRTPLLVDVITQLLWVTSSGPQSYLVPLLDRTLMVQSKSDSVVRAKSLVSLAFALRGTGEETRIEPLTSEGVSMAERLADPKTLCACLRLAIMALRAHPRTLQRRLALGEQYISAAHSSGDDEALSCAYSWYVLHLLEAARLDDFERALLEYRRMSVTRFGLHQYYVGAADVTLALLRGEWQEAEQRIERLLAVGAKMRRQDADGVYSAQMFTLNRDLGRLGATRAAVEQFVAGGAANAWLPGLMLTCAELGMLSESQRFLDQVSAHDFDKIPRDDMFVACLVYCAETCYRLRDVSHASALYALLAPHAGSTANHPRAVCFGAADLYLAMLAVVAGDSERAAGHFEAALAMNRAMAAWPWLARTLFHCSTFLVTLDGGDAGVRALELRADAEQLAARLGMSALLEEIGTATRGVGRGSLPDGLTAREVEVLQLLALGRSNKDISLVLSISLNTVATHVRSILTKTRSANRTEAAAYAIQQGLHDTRRQS